jgi:hypothetical protein
MDCPNELKATHKFKCFWVVQGLNVFFLPTQTFVQKNEIALKKMCFFHMLLGAFSSPLSPLLFFCS